MAEKDYVDLLERHPTSDRQRLTLSVHYDEPSESFLVPIEYLPIPFERPHGSTSYFLVIPDASPGGRWRPRFRRWTGANANWSLRRRGSTASGSCR